MVSSNDNYSERAMSAKMHCCKTPVHIAIANFNNYWSYKGLQANENITPEMIR